MMSFAAFVGAIELGLIYSIMALGVFLSFRTLNTPDLTVDGSIVTGAAAAAVTCALGGSPTLGLLLAFIVGCGCGAITALLNTKLKIQPLLAGILVMLGLYSVNLRIFGLVDGSSNVSLTMSQTIYKQAKELLPVKYPALVLGILLLVIILVLFYLFLQTRLGFSLRATGDNEYMVRAAGINDNAMKVMGLALSNGLVGLAGGLLAQYQSFADVNMGVGMVVIGLASVIIGEVVFSVFSTRSLLLRLIAVAMGAVLYRMIISIAINMGGMSANDLKLVSAVIVTLALSTGIISQKLSAFKKPMARSAVRQSSEIQNAKKEETL